MIKFIKWVLCLEPKQRYFYSDDNRLIFDNETCTISLNLDNPEVLKGIEKSMNDFRKVFCND